MGEARDSIVAFQNVMQDKMIRSIDQDIFQKIASGAKVRETAPHPFKRMGSRDWCALCWNPADDKLHLPPVPKFKSVEEADAWLDAQTERMDEIVTGAVGSGKSAITSPAGYLSARTLYDVIDKVNDYTF